jgi:hypothetical protein
MCASEKYDMLKTLIPLLHDIDPKYFINFGTLLGAIRDRDFIPYDTDIDLILPSDTHAKWEEWKHILEQRGLIIFKSTILRVCVKSAVTHKNNAPPWKEYNWFPYVDVYSLDHSRVTVGPYKNPYPYYPLQNCTIRDLQLPCPHNAHTLLRKIYGNDYMTPQETHKWGKRLKQKENYHWEIRHDRAS